MFSKKKHAMFFIKEFVRYRRRKQKNKKKNNFNSISYMLSTHAVKCGMSSRGFPSKLRKPVKNFVFLLSYRPRNVPPQIHFARILLKF